MKKIIMFTAILALVACAKYTTPKKVTNKLTVGSWKVFSFVDNDKSLILKYQDVAFSFLEEGAVNTTSDSNVSGTWSVGTDKNPALLYLNFNTEADSMHVISDDWVVYKLTNSECVLKRNMGKDFDYDGSLDGLTLKKKTNE
jgi:hypothetical protein